MTATFNSERRNLLGLNPWVERVSDRFSNPLLYSQHGGEFRFYSDLVRNRIVLINFFYTHCNGICLPTTANLLKVHRLLGERVGSEILFISLSLDPERDSQAALYEYAGRFGHPKGWLFLTGDYEQLEELRYQLGAYDLDPVIDADREQHTGLVTFGNDNSNRWAALPAMMDAEGLSRGIRRITR